MLEVAANLEFDSSDEMQLISNYSVGFALRSENNGMPEASLAGSGTLVRGGAIFGLLTAAHVLENLLHRDEVILLNFPTGDTKPQRQTIIIGNAESVVFSSNKKTCDGPDLAFLRLPMKNEANLRATGSFFDLFACEANLRDGEPIGLGTFETIVGVVNEWTEETLSGERLRKKFQLLMAGAEILQARTVNGFDILTISPLLKKSDRPTTYQGVSGGALWSIYFQPDGSNKVVQRRLIGTAFYELPSESGALQIVCHGSKSIYERLLPEIQQKWSD